MSQKPDRLCHLILLLGALTAVVAATLLSAGSMTNNGALFSSIAIIVFWLIAAVILIRHPLFASLEHSICALVGLYLSLCLRLCLFDYISPDYVSFLSLWTGQMRHMTLRQALATPIGDYNMPYLYLLLLISRLPFYDLYCIKLVSVLADVFLAIAVARLAGLTVRRQSYILAAFFAALLAPTVFLNSAYWGQCDGIYTCFALWGLYYGLKKRPIVSLALFAFSFSFKLQAIFILPILAFLLLKEYIQLKHLPVFPAVFLAVMLPVLLAGRSLSDTFSIYVDQVGAYPYLSLNATSFWSLIPNNYYAYLDPAPILLAGIVTLLLLYLLLPRCRSFTTGDLIDICLVFCLAIPWLLPKMHERYFYLAEILSILYAVRHPRHLAVAVILLGGGFLAYSSYLFGKMPILSTELVAAIFGITLLYLIVQLSRPLQGRSLSNQGGTSI